MTLKRFALLAAAGLLALPGAARAQVPDDGWTVELNGGAQLFAESSALETGPVLGLTALYHLTPRIALGPSVSYTAATTDGSFFIGVIDFGPDSTRVYQVGQEVSALNFGASAVFDFMPDNRFAPYLAVGGGGYVLYLEPVSNEAARRVGGPMLEAGGGVRFSITEQAGIDLDVRDIIYLDFDREELNPIDPRHRNRQFDDEGNLVEIRFPGAEPDVPEAQSTIHNIRLTLGFSYRPRGFTPGANN